MMFSLHFKIVGAIFIFLAVFLDFSFAAKRVEIKNGQYVGKSNANTFVNSHVKLREKRSAPTINLTAEAQTECVTKHNALRKLETEASNMRYMQWDQDIAVMGQAWADACDFVHGQPSGYSSSEYSSVGQNLYFSTGFYAPSYAIQEFWDEKTKFNYNYDDGTFDAGGVVGHYTQVAWGDSSEVGCGFSFCPVLTDSELGTSYNNAYYIVCNYGPPGNFGGVKPFKKGNDCSDCSGGQYWCFEGLCRNCTADGNEAECTCKGTVCQNCATVTSSCTCECQPGHFGEKCDVVCEDTDANCAAYPVSYCTDAGFGPQVRTACPKLCGLCVGDDGGARPTCEAYVEQEGTGGGGVAGGDGEVEEVDKDDDEEEGGLDCSATACENDAEGGPYNSQCVCYCDDEWQGETCQFSVAEAVAGVVITMEATLSQWSDIWTAIKPILLDGVNDHCDANYDDCCPGDAARTSASGAEFLSSESSLKVGLGYPAESSTSGHIDALIYVNYEENNALCAAARKRRSAEDMSLSRSKRAADFNLPQDALLEAVQSAETEMGTATQSCCGVSIATIAAAKVEEKPYNRAGTQIASVWLGACVLLHMLSKV